MSSIDKTIRMRSRRLYMENCPCRDLQSIDNYTLVESNKWNGLKDNNGMMLLAPIYDTIDVIADINMCIMKLDETYVLYDILNKCVVNLPKMSAYQRYGFVLNVKTENGVGLFSCRLRKLLIPAQFAETTHIDRGRYLWVRQKDDNFAFFDTQTSAIIKCPKDTNLCLESDVDHMFIVVNNEVKCINESGIFDSNTLRMFALDNGGRIRLCNQNAHCTIIADIYGHIIN